MTTAGIIRGTDVLIYLDGNPIAHSQEHNLEISRRIRDFTSKSSMGWRRMKPTVATWQITGRHLFAFDATYGGQHLFNLLKNNTQVTVKLSTGVNGDFEYSGTGYITQLKKDYANEELTTYSYTIEGDGELTDIYSIFINNGYLYNSVALASVKDITPDGYHIPTYAEFVAWADAVLDIDEDDYYDTRPLFATTVSGGTNTLGFNALLSGSGYTTDGGGFNAKELMYFPIMYTTGLGLITMSCAEDGLEIPTTKGALTSLFLSLRFVRDNATGWSEGDQIQDLDGNAYDTVKIGDLIWTAQNYASSKYANGDSISVKAAANEDLSYTVVPTDRYTAYNFDQNEVFIS